MERLHKGTYHAPAWRDYEKDRRAWEAALRAETRASRFWWTLGTLALAASLVLIFSCAPAPAPLVSYSDMACEARAYQDSIAVVEHNGK